MIDRWIAEATECDFKVALEVKKPKSWLKSVSAFANGIGGTLFFGIDDDRNVIGLSDAQTDAETISRLIKERITPYPSFVLAPERENGKDILVLSVSSGRSTPYYRSVICPAFPPRAATLSLQIFSDGWAIWSGKAAVLRRLPNPTMRLITTVLSWSLNSIRTLLRSK